MTLPMLVELGWKSAVLAGATLLLLRLLAGRSATERSFAAHLGLAAVMLLPVSISSLPTVQLTAPEPVMAIVPVAASRRTLELGPALENSNTDAAALDPAVIATVIYLVPAGLLLMGLLVAILRLGRLKRRAQILTDPRWHVALARAQLRLGFKHGAVLLVSPDVAAPVSWGLIRPTILLSVEDGRDARDADAILAHELAHIARFDWLKLVAARLTVALLWFNPLVWMLARRCHDLCEEAADDAVLRAGVSRTDYAEMLVDFARRGAGPRVLAVHAVAPGKSALAGRVAKLLDDSRRRTSAGPVWTSAAVALAIGVATPLAGLDLVAAPVPFAGFERDAGARAARRLTALDHPAALALADAIQRRDWNARRVRGSTIFHLPAAIPPLVSALADDSAVVRRIALWGLSEMRPAPIEASGAVARHLTDPDPMVRGQAARTLGDFGAVRHARAIAPLLTDPVPEVAAQAAHALGDLRQPASRAELERALDHPDPSVRDRVTWALRQVAESTGPPPRSSLH